MLIQMLFRVPKGKAGAVCGAERELLSQGPVRGANAGTWRYPGLQLNVRRGNGWRLKKAHRSLAANAVSHLLIWLV